MNVQRLRELFAQHFRWEAWEALLDECGVEIDRPRGSAHPDYPSIIYPMDYGFVPGTRATDDEGIDVFLGGTPASGLAGLILTQDHRRGDREGKLLYQCSPREIYLAHGFINFDHSLLEGLLVLRQPMHRLWEASRK